MSSLIVPSRREFVRTVASASALTLLAGCSTETVIAPHVRKGFARLSARPTNWMSFRLKAGLHDVTIAGTRLVTYLPASAKARGWVPVLLFLHGAGRTVMNFIEAHREAADAAGVMIVAPYADFDTWDAISGGFDKDVAALDVVLQWVFYQVPAHPRAVVISGFSDGAVYALAMGRANGDLFSRIVAYSPHSLLLADFIGRPPVLVCHGTMDSVVPFGVTSQYIVPTLREAGHEVDFVSFEGGHAVPLAIIDEVVHATRTLAR